MILDEIKIKIAEALDISEGDLVYPPNSDLGDFSWPLFKLSQEKKMSPVEIAEKIKEELLSRDDLMNILEKIEIAGPYLNFFIKPSFLITELLGNIFSRGRDYGRNNDGDGDLSIFEFSNVNTHKNFHIGHLRNISLGDSLCRLHGANGFKSYPVSYVNDFGIHTAKAIWNYKKSHNPDLNKCYSNTVKEIGDNPDLLREISKIMSDIETRRGDNYRVWQKTRKISLKEFDEIYKKLKIKFRKNYFESEVIDQGREMVADFVKKRVLRKSEGAIIADLEKYDLGVLPIIRSDGTALYPVADLALAERKFKDFKGLKNSFIVVDVRQSLYFKQLFKVLRLVGYQQNFNHLSYDFITLPEGMMSSRSGNAIPFYDLYQKVLDKLIMESKKRHPEWSDKKIKRNCELLTVAILKFEMLKVSPRKIITFNMEEATKFDGFSALYILYGLVRIKSILKKACFRPRGVKRVDFSELKTEYEKKISLKLAKYPDIVKRAEVDFDPSEIAKYLFELFKLFSDYYQNVKVLSAEKNIKKARLVFMGAIALVAENALELLGINGLDEI
jgi:arginyl-tRNA synthetase